MKCLSPEFTLLQKLPLNISVRARAACILFVVTLMNFVIFGWPSVGWTKTCRGEVVDEETGKPPEGAVVVVI